MDKFNEKDDIVINQIISWFDNKKHKEIFATIYYTQTSFDGEKRQLTITVAEKEIIDYYIAKLHKQPNSNGKHITRDIRDYHHNNQASQDFMASGFNKTTYSDSNNSRKLSIRITSIAVATVIAILSGNYILARFFDKKGKAEKITNKIEQSGYNVLSKTELQDLVGYIEEQNDDNKYQKDERDLNDRILKGLVKNQIQQNVIRKAQGLFKNCFIESNRYGYNKNDVYKYFMYMSSLFMNGDYLGIGSVGDANIAIEMKDTYDNTKDFREKAQGFAKGTRISLNRIMYSATENEAHALKTMPLLAQKILMEQYLTICKSLEITLEKEDRPSWWSIGNQSYSEERVIKEIEIKNEILKQDLIENRLKSDNSTKKR